MKYNTFTDSAIAGMHRYLKSKEALPLGDVASHTAEIYHMTNSDSLSFFELMFKNDLERLGLMGEVK